MTHPPTPEQAADPPEILYRYEGAGVYETDFLALPHPRTNAHVNLLQYKIVKVTQKGCWINHFGGKKFILFSARKRWAYPTKKEALVSFRKRKERQVVLLQAQLKRAEAYLQKAKELEIDSPSDDRTASDSICDSGY
jgi:hypothetical protein